MTLRLKDKIEGKISDATNADAVPWSGVSGKPSTFTPSSHNHDDRYYTESEINDGIQQLYQSIIDECKENLIPKNAKWIDIEPH